MLTSQPSSAPKNGSHSKTPDLAAQLDDLAVRLATVEQSLAPVRELAAQAPHAMATATDTFDDLLRRRPDLPDRLQRLVELSERLTNDDTMAALHKALDVLEGMEGMVATAIDTLDARLRDFGDLHERIQAAERLFATFTHPGHLDTLSRLADASMRGATAEPEPLGPWAAYRATREPDVQRALGLAINIARALGAKDRAQLAPPSHKEQTS